MKHRSLLANLWTCDKNEEISPDRILLKFFVDDPLILDFDELHLHLLAGALVRTVRHLIDVVPAIILNFWMEQCTLKIVNNYLNTNIYSYLETSGG